MEIKQLKYFMIVAKHENMTRAAKELHIAQPAISQSIRRLEDELGVFLFDRIGKSIKLNSQGNHLLKTIPLMLESFEEIKFQLRQMDSAPMEQIKILVLSSSVVIPDLLKTYTESHPNTNFIISQSTKDFDYDICISSIPLDEHSDEGIVVQEEEIVMVIPNKHPLAMKKKVLLEDIQNEPFITLNNQKVFAQIMNYYFQKVNIQPKTSFEAESPSMVRGLIEAGLGIGFYPRLTWGKLNQEQVVVRKISDITCGRKIIVKIAKGKIHYHGLKEFSNHIYLYYKGLV